jgi:hypothetical protein
MGTGISYDPGIAYRGDQYAFAGLSSLGQDVGKAIHESMQERRKQEQLQGYNDAIVNHAAQTGLITPEELNKYNAASLTQKTSMAAGYAANIHDDLQRQLTGAQTRNIASEATARLGMLPSTIANVQSETAARNLITPAQAANIGSETISRNTMLPVQVSQAGAQIGNIQSETNARNTLTPAQLANMESETTLKNIQSLLGVQEGNLRSKKLQPGAVERIMEGGQFKGWKITQPDGTIAIKTPGSDIGELLAGLGVVGAGINAATPGATPSAVPTPTPAAPAPRLPTDRTAALNQARAAISAGAPRAAVIARLQQAGIDPSGL